MSTVAQHPKAAADAATPAAVGPEASARTASGSASPPAKIQKRRGRPPSNRPSAAAADDVASTGSNSGSPSKPPQTGKRRGRPPGSSNKSKSATVASLNSAGEAHLPPSSANVIISSLVYTPPDPSNHPLRKHASVEPASRLKFNKVKVDPSPSSQLSPSKADLIPTHISTPRHVPSRSKARIFELEDAPIFYPTVEEFADPIKYIAWLASPDGGNAKEYGIAKIVPPEGWAPDFVLDQQKFRFRTRVQRLNSLSAEARATMNYHEQLQKFHSQQGSKRVSIPIIDRKPTDLYKLRRVVESYGGFDTVVKARKWTEVTRKLGYPEKECAQLSAQVKAAYMKIIMPFEIFLAKAKEQGRTVSFSSTPSGGGGPGMTMAGSAPLHSASAVTNGAPQLLMTVNGASPDASVATGDNMDVDEPSATAPSIQPESPQQPQPGPSQATQQQQSEQRQSSSAVQAQDVGASGGLANDAGDAEPPNHGSETHIDANGTVNHRADSANATPSTSRLSHGPDGQAQPAEAAVAAPEGSPSATQANGSAAPNGKGWGDELLAAGLTQEEITQMEAEAAGKRRSGRKRFEASTHLAPLTPTSSRKRKHADDAQTVVEILTTQGAEEQMCEICLRGDNGTSMLLCDDCNRGYHMFCLDPPLTTIPKSQWFCPPCLVGTGNDFGFDDGETHSLHSFWQRAELFRNSWWTIKRRQEEEESMRAAMFGAALADTAGSPASPQSTSPTKVTSPEGDGKNQEDLGQTSNINDTAMLDVTPKREAKSEASNIKENGKPVPAHGLSRSITGTQYSISEDDVEREYWRLVHSPQETVEVEYGADVHSTTHGSALPTLETHPENPYSKDAWNLNNLPITAGSLLRYIKSDISGMTVPWLYVGMMFSTFCWHNEDHFTYSINYQHWGDTKTWYGVPGGDAEKFEEAMRKVAPDLFETSPDLLFQLVTMMSPGRLREEGVRVYAADQRPNEFIITFPKAYHSGFNQGFNLNEAVNFALPDWVDAGLECVKRYQQFRKYPVFSHDELLCTILHHHLNVNSAVWMLKPIGDMVDRELAARAKIRNALPRLRDKLEEIDRPEAEYQCAHCNTFSYLSQVVGSSGTRVACLEHASIVLADEHPSKWSLRLRYADEYLDTMRSKVSDRASQPSAWRNRFRKLLLSAPRPTLKSLRSLLADGEKITSLPEVEQLRHFVDRANDWVERAMTITVRRHPRAAVEPTSGRRGRASAPTSDSFSAVGPVIERTPEQVHALLEEVEGLGFDCPEINVLNGIVNDIAEFKQRVTELLTADKAGKEIPLTDCYDVQELGDSTNVDMPERRELATYIKRRTWYTAAKEAQADSITAEEGTRLLNEAVDAKIDAQEPLLLDLQQRVEQGKDWVRRAAEVQGRPLTGPRITREEIEEVLDFDPRIPIDDELHAALVLCHKKIIELSKTLTSIVTTQQAKNHKYMADHKAEDPSEMLQRAKRALEEADRIHFEVPKAEFVRAYIKRHDTWVKRFEAAVLEAFSPLYVPSRNRLEGMMDALCSEISHTADPWDHYPTNPPRRHCVCRTLEKPPDVHREVRRCTSCQTVYHLPCLKIEEEWTYQEWELASKTWRCPICDPVKLPTLLQHRQTLALDSIAPLVEDWRAKDFMFIPYRWFPLRKALDRLDGLTEAVSNFLAKDPNPAVPEHAHMLWHSLRKVLACPVDVKLADGTSVVDKICDILYRYAGLNKWGEPVPERKQAKRTKPKEAFADTGQSAAMMTGPPSQGPPPQPLPAQPIPSVLTAPIDHYVPADNQSRSQAHSPYPPPAAIPPVSQVGGPSPHERYGPRPGYPHQPSPNMPPPEVVHSQSRVHIAHQQSSEPHQREAHIPVRHHLDSDVGSSARVPQLLPSHPPGSPLRTAERDAQELGVPGPSPAGQAPYPRPDAIRHTEQASPLLHPKGIAPTGGYEASTAVGPSTTPTLPRQMLPQQGKLTAASPGRYRTVVPDAEQRTAHVDGARSEHADPRGPVNDHYAISAQEPNSRQSFPSRALPDGASEGARGSNAFGDDGQIVPLQADGNPALISASRKRGKRAKLTFVEELGATMPDHQGMLATCLCRQHRELEMISCDRCSTWFHMDCVLVDPLQADPTQRWLCPFCCLKTERKYQHAEIRVKDAQCPPGVYIDMRSTLRSTDDVIRKPQLWTQPHNRRILLHLQEFVPAVAAESDKEVVLPLSREGSLSGAAVDASSSTLTQPVARPEYHGQASGPARAVPADEDHARAVAPPVNEDSLHQPSGYLEHGSDRPQASRPVTTVVAADASEAQIAQERHRLGMQNLYARGVTDAMISKWFIGWDGRTLVYPHVDRNGHMIELDLGPSIQLAPDDPDGSRLIQKRIARKEEEDRVGRVLPPAHSRRVPPDTDMERRRPAQTLERVSSEHRPLPPPRPSAHPQAYPHPNVHEVAPPEVIQRDVEPRRQLMPIPGPPPPASQVSPHPSAVPHGRWQAHTAQRSPSTVRPTFDERVGAHGWDRSQTRSGVDWDRAQHVVRQPGYDPIGRHEPPSYGREGGPSRSGGGPYAYPATGGPPPHESWDPQRASWAAGPPSYTSTGPAPPPRRASPTTSPHLARVPPSGAAPGVPPPSTSGRARPGEYPSEHGAHPPRP